MNELIEKLKPVAAFMAVHGLVEQAYAVEAAAEALARLTALEAVAEAARKILYWVPESSNGGAELRSALSALTIADSGGRGGVRAEGGT